MPLFNSTITLGVTADLTDFDRKILDGMSKAQRNMKPLQVRFANNLSQPLGKITGDIGQFNKSIDAAAARVLAFSSTVGVVNGVVNSFRSLIKETIAVEKALLDINVVLNTNTAQLESFKNSLFDIAKNTGQSFKAVSEAAVELSRQGLGIEKTLKATNAALVLTRLSGLDAAESVKVLTAAINGFNSEALDYESVVNRLVNVDSNFAVSTKDLAEAITRVGSTAEDANVSFNELLATVTAVQQTTSRGGAVIGNALKTIFTRVGREDTVAQLRELGVAIDQSQTGIQKLQAIAATLKEVDTSTANTIKELAGGVFQINVVSAALGDLNKDYSIYKNALEAANTQTAAAIIRNNALNESLDSLAKSAGNNIDQLQSKIGKLGLGSSLKDLFQSFNGATKFLIDSLDGESVGEQIGQNLVKGLGGFITGPAALLAIGTFLRLVAKIGSDAFVAFRQFSGISTEAQKISTIQSAAQMTLERNSSLYQQQLATTKNIGVVQRQILADLQTEIGQRSIINKLAINPALARAAANSYDFKGGNLVPRGADGILPALISESRDVRAGVGGASSSAKSVFIPRFNYGDRQGPVVVNTSEKIVENFMGGKGSAVLNKDMIKALGGEGKLSGLGKVKNVSEGYVPNLASFDVAGGKVNLKKRGDNIILDEILSGFDAKGERLQGTGIVRQAFDVAVNYGKKQGANNLIVDILNSKVASSLNSNPRFAQFGPFSRGKFKIPLMGLADGFVPSLNSGSNLTSDALKSFSNPKELLKFISSTGIKANKGSSRIFVDVGGGKGLKVAFNKAGIAQNEKEFPILSKDYYAREQYGDILPQGYDFDEERGLYGFVEKLNPVGANQFKKLAGKGKRAFGWLGGLETSPEGSFGYNVNQFIGDYGLRNDFQGGRNIGLSNDGKLKLMDIGFSQEIAEKFYRTRDLGRFAGGHVPNLVFKRFTKDANVLSDIGSFGKILDNPAVNEKISGKGVPDLVFKKFRNTFGPDRNAEIAQEFEASKMAEAMGLPIAKVFGSLKRAQARGGIFKEKINGFMGNRIGDLASEGIGSDVTSTLRKQYIKAGIEPDDLRGANYMIKGSPMNFMKLYAKEGAEAAKAYALRNAVVVDPGLFKKREKLGMADGFVPSLAMSPLRQAVSRETTALIQQGYAPSDAKRSIRVDASPILQGPKNPIGLGVFNTLQGQTSLKKAFADHGGQNLKTVGAAHGYIPNLVDPLNESDVEIRKSRLTKTTTSASVTAGLNAALSELSRTTNSDDYVAAVKKVKSFEKVLSKKTLALVEKSIAQAKQDVEANPSTLYEKDGAFISKAKFGAINESLIKIGDTKSPLEAEQLKKTIKEQTANLASESIKTVNGAVKNQLKLGAAGRDKTVISLEEIQQSASARVASRGAFSLQSSKSILQSEQGFSNLPPLERAALRERINTEAKSNRRQGFERAGLGLAFAGSIASPFIDQGAEALRKNSPNASAAVSGLGGAVTGASLGVAFGPVGALVGGLAGGIVGLVKALDGSESKATDLTTALEKLSSEASANVNSFASFIQTQQKLNGLIADGGKAGDISRVSDEIRNVFSSITDSKARRGIIEAAGDIEKLSESLAKVQKSSFIATRRQEAVTVAAQERAKGTTLGIRSSDALSSQVINGIGNSLTAGASKDDLKALNVELSKLGGNVSLDQFANALKKVGVESDQAASIFEDLGKPLNRLLLVKSLKESLDIAQQLDAVTESAIKFKKGITDLNKTISTITSVNSANGRQALSAESNAFSTQQNGRQLSAGLKFFDAEPFAQAQLATAFQSNQVRFDSQQARKSTTIDTVSQVADSVTQNRIAFGADKTLLDKLDRFIVTQGAEGNIAELAGDALRKGLGSGDDVKTFSSLGVLLNEANNKLASINDNERNQLTVLRQNLAAQKERIQIENKTNLLGGPEGQIGFATQGFGRFGNRAANSNLESLGGQAGAFGRNENALGILEFQKSLGGVDGLDVRSLIPNAQNIVSDSIKQSLLEGFGRLNVPITPQIEKQAGSIAELNAAKAFGRKELTADDIGNAVGKSLDYQRLEAGNVRGFSLALNGSEMTSHTSAVPEIRDFLVSRFGLEKQRVDIQSTAVETNKKISTAESGIALLRSDIEKTKVEGGKTLQKVNVPVKGIFPDINGLNSITAGFNQGQYNQTFGRREFVSPQAANEFLADAPNAQLQKLIPDDGNVAKFRENLNKVVGGSGSSNSPLLRESLRLGLGDSGFKGEPGKQVISDEGFSKVLTALEKVGGVVFDAKTRNVIESNLKEISKLESTIVPLQEEVARLKTNLDTLNATIEAKKIAGPEKVGGNPFPRKAFNPARLNEAVPSIEGFAPGEFQRFVGAQSKAISPFKDDAAKKEAELAITKANTAKFGPLDTNTIGALSQQRLRLEQAGGSNPDIEKSIRGLENVLLRQAQRQQFSLGAADPELQKFVGKGDFRDNSKKLSSNNAEASFESIVEGANEAFVSGFATDADLKRVGIRINQGLEDYVRTRIKLGDTKEEAEKAGKEMRERIQKQLDQIEVKLPKGKIQEFGQGFSSGLEDLQKKYDDLGKLGEDTAASFVDGFGDAFFQVASGAESARDAVGGMLSGIAADLSKFFAKRAFAQIFAMSAGNANAGAFGEAFGITNKAQGGIIRRAQGGGIPALVMGGERAFGPDVVSAMGPDFFKDLNAGKIDKFNGGGKIKGGSGYKDDVFGMFPEGSFILQKAAVNKYGPEYLDQIESSAKMAKGGKVQKAFWGALLGGVLGGALQGAAAGAVTAKITGGDWKKGALYGGITGGIAGGFSGASYAKTNPNAGFGGGFGNSFAWTGLGGDKATSSAAGQPSAAGVPSSLSPNGPSYGSASGPSSLGNIADLNGGKATGLGNQSLTAAQTQTKPSVWKTGALNLGTSLALALASSALAPKVDKQGNKVVQGTGSITTYRSDGALISSPSGKYFVDKKDFSSTSQFEQSIVKNGGNIPAGGVQSLANGGEVGSGSGSVSYSDRAVLNTINKTFPQGYALGGPITPTKPSGMFSMGSSMEEFSPAMNPYISVGSGTGDDVNIRAKKGEYMMTDKAVDMYGLGFMGRVNRGEIDPRATRSGVIEMNSGGPMEYNPADRDRGLFSLASANGTPSAPAVAEAPRGGGGGDTNIDITINMSGDGTASVSTKASGKEDGEGGSIDSAKFGAKVKAMFAELIEAEKRPGGSLSKDNM